MPGFAPAEVRKHFMLTIPSFCPRSSNALIKDLTLCPRRALNSTERANVYVEGDEVVEDALRYLVGIFSNFRNRVGLYANIVDAA
jgi:hypothetical protein